MENNTAISLEDIDFSYKKKESLLNRLSINVPENSIYGFIGHNGAGKSTTIRLIMGLLRARNGTIHVHGKDINHNRNEVLRNTYAIIEKPVFYNHLTAIENLKILCYYRSLNTKRIWESLSLVGLESRKKVKEFSTGMKQRLGLAAALLSDAGLMILDEPLNGLDPSGIIELRNIIIKLNNEKKITFFISSHILSEIESTCTHVGILKNGKLAYEGPLTSEKMLEGSKSVMKLKVSAINNSIKLLMDGGFTSSMANGNLLQVNISQQKDIAKIISLLDSGNIEIQFISYQLQSLEELFLSL